MIEIARIFLGVAGSLRFAILILVLATLAIISPPVITMLVINQATGSLEVALIALVFAFPLWLALLNRTLSGRPL